MSDSRTPEQRFRDRLARLLTTVRREGACPLCVLRAVMEAAEALAGSTHASLESLKTHGITPMGLVSKPAKVPPKLH
jgi:hypothetical protein